MTDLFVRQAVVPMGSKMSRRVEIAQTRARQVCRECPRLAECEAWVLDAREDPCPDMVVAALLPDERRRVRRSKPLQLALV